ncbi:hypothetical protein AQUCO_00300412v1 [Aquilegia coerulea]|nr:hypothetical protein AQUCO_00300412v1 [Aquilegia coerulea]
MNGTKSCMQRLHSLVRQFNTSTSTSSPSTLPHSTPVSSFLQTLTKIQKLREIHAQLIVTGSITDPYIASQLLTSPALCRDESNYTHLIFTQVSSPNIFIWNTMIKKLIDGKSLNTICSSLFLYQKLLDAGFRPNGHTFMYLIRALTPQMYLLEGEVVHSHVVKFGFGSSQYVSSALVGFYVACVCVDRGRRLFDELPEPGLILWTSMVRAYVRANCPKEALEVFGKMREVGMMPDPVAIATIVSACTQLGNLIIAKTMHGIISKTGVEIDDFVCSALLGMYGDCGSLVYAHRLFCEMSVKKNVVVWNTMIHQCIKHENLDDARDLFRKMPERDVVSWNTMIGGLCQMGRSREAIVLFQDMELAGMKPNKSTMLSTLSACASLGALDTGTWIHAFVEKKRLNSDRSLDPSLIDMYSKCGSVEKAIQVFEKVPRRDVFSWTSIICGLAMHGHGKKAIHHFSKMQEAGVKPDDVTFIGVLNACAHAGLLDQGKKYFDSMSKVYNLTPKIEHFGCMIDLLGRNGSLKEAYDLIMDMPMEPNNVIWGTLLSACRVHKDVELGEVVAEKMLELDPADPWTRVMLSNIYAEACKWDGVMTLRKELKKTGLKKAPGCSSLEVNGKVHEFLVGDNLHPQQKEIQSMLSNIEIIIKLQLEVAIQ